MSDLSPLAGLSALRNLHVSGTQVSDISPLAKLSELRYLFLQVTPVSRDSVEALRKALPDCTISV